MRIVYAINKCTWFCLHNLLIRQVYVIPPSSSKLQEGCPKPICRQGSACAHKQWSNRTVSKATSGTRSAEEMVINLFR